MAESTRHITPASPIIPPSDQLNRLQAITSAIWRSSTIKKITTPECLKSKWSSAKTLHNRASVNVVYTSYLLKLLGVKMTHSC